MEQRQVDVSAFSEIIESGASGMTEFACTLQNFLLSEQSADIKRKHDDELLQSREHAAHIYFDNALTAIVETDDPSWQILRANPAAARITGFEIDELLTQCLLQLVPETARSSAEESLSLLAARGTSHAEWTLKRRDGKLIIIEMSSIKAGDYHYIHVFDDVTEQRNTTRKLDNAREAAESANLAKSHFLANISHEIRTPLNGILGMAQLCQLTQLNPRQREYIEMISKSGQALLQIINDLLDFAKIEAGRMEYEKANFSLDDIVDELAAFSSQAVADKSIEIVFNIPRSVPRYLSGDRLRLLQCLNNLLSNAAKFTNSGLVELEIAVEEQQESRVMLRFTVTDTGIGIHQDVLDKLFQPFSQVDASTTRRFGGTGLGLVIVRELTHGMGGEMQVESIPGKGSQFTLRLPFQVSFNRNEALAETHGRAVLICRRSATREAVSRLLETAGWQVIAEENMLEPATMSNYDLVMIDYAMGYPSLEEIMSLISTGQFPVLVLTGVAEASQSMASWQELSGCELLTRPLTPNSLRRALLRNGLLSADTRETATSSVIPSDFAGIHILVAEDNRVNQSVIMDMLKQGGIHTTLAHNGREVMELMESLPNYPDLILMDVQMPEMDGLEATRILRSKGFELPIVAISAGASHVEQASSLDAGMNDFLAKPIDIDELWAVMTRWVPPRDQRMRKGSDKHETIEQRFLNDHDIIRKARHIFKDTHAGDAAMFQQLLVEERFSDIAKAAHAIKGSSRTIGEDEIAGLALMLEIAAKAGDKTRVAPMIVRLEQLLIQYKADQ